jgi:hypothetical protein
MLQSESGRWTSRHWIADCLGGGQSDEVGRELIVWREAHPRASLSQIEEAVYEAMQRLQTFR